VGIEITLDKLEETVLLLLAQLPSIRFQGLIDLQVFYGDAATDGDILRYVLNKYHEHWFESENDRFLNLADPFDGSRGVFAYPRHVHAIPEDATSDEKYRIFKEQSAKEFESAKAAAQDAEKNALRRIYVLERLGLLKIYDIEVNSVVSLLKKDAKEQWVRITPAGEELCQRIQSGRLLIVRPDSVKRTTIFVACAFGQATIDQLYSTVLEPTCKSLGYRPVRVDLSEPATTITDAILQGIQKAACIIADLTHARPSVYFEVGFAQGLGVPSVMTCREDHYRGMGDSERVHFDLEQYKISFWKQLEDQSFVWKSQMDPATRLASVLSASK
jgi:hypothetical protein